MHKRAQRSCKTCKHKNYCRSIRRKENSEIIHSRKLIGSFKAIAIFPTLMEKVILLGLSGTTKWSLTWSSGGNTFFFCLNKDFGRTLTWTRVKCGLLPGRTARSWRTFVAPLHPVHVSSLFCHFYLLLEHLISLLGRRRALLVDGKSQHRWQLCGYILCSLERTPSNKLNFPYPDIIYQNLHYTLCKNYLHYIHYLQTSIFSPQLSKHCSRNLPSLNLTALRAVLRITAPRAGMSNYVNKQIPLKTGLASYLVSKLHGSEVRNCRDKRCFFLPLVTITASLLNFCRKQQEKK